MNNRESAFPGVQQSDVDIKCDCCGAWVRFPHIASPGLTMRDYVAAAALQGLISSAAIPGDHAEAERPRKSLYAEWAYAYADAMLQAREASHA